MFSPGTRSRGNPAAFSTSRADGTSANTRANSQTSSGNKAPITRTLPTAQGHPNDTTRHTYDHHPTPRSDTKPPTQM